MSTGDVKLSFVGILWLCSLAIVFCAGYMTRDSMTAPEDVSYAPAQEQSDGSIVLERDPEPAREPPPHQLPKGAVEERRVTLQIRPNTKTEKPHSTKPEKPLNLTLSLVQVDGGRRVIGSADGAEIVGGLDMPILPADLARRFDWAAGASYDPFTESPGIWIERDYGRIRVGGDLYQDRTGTQTGMAARLRVGWVF